MPAGHFNRFRPTALPGARQYAVWDIESGTYAVENDAVLKRPSYGKAIAAAIKLEKAAAEAAKAAAA
jgi:hypothetical protein